MNRKVFAKLAAGFACATLAAAAMAQPVTLKYSAWLPATHWMNAIGIVTWAKDVETATRGNVKIEFLPKGVGAPAAQYDSCRDGLADVCLFVASYQPGRFPLAEMAELPLLGNDPAVVAPVFYSIYRDRLAKHGEFADVQLITLFSGSPSQILSTRKTIKGAGDLAGAKIRTASGAATRAAELVGAVPLLKPATEAYELVSSGIVDGEFSSFEAVKGSKTIELHKRAAIVDGGLANTTLGVIVNKAKWNALPQADREAIMKVSGEVLASKIGLGYRAQDEEALGIMKSRNYVFEQIKGAEHDKLKQALVPLDAKWYASAKAKGAADAEKVLADFRAGILAATPK